MSELRQALGRCEASELEGELGLVLAELKQAGLLSEQSLPRVWDLMCRFRVFAERGFQVGSLGEVLPLHASTFVTAPSSTVSRPTVATMHLRRSAVRLLFRFARELGLAAGDPTLDLKLPPRSRAAVRPLTDDEIPLCRAAALQSLTSTGLSAPWALAEATARTAELSHLCIADLDLAACRVWIHGSPRTKARWGRLSEWGAHQLERRLGVLARTSSSSTLLVYGGAGSPESRQASSCQAIGETLRRAGFRTEPDVRPLSVAGWAGAQVFAETGRIEAAARALGVRSLDGAARLIDFDWRIGGEDL